MKFQGMPLVYVEWVDSFSPASGGWRDNDDVAGDADKQLVCRSVGWIVAESKKTLVLAAHVSDSEERTGQMCIPQVAVVKRKKVKL